MQIPTYLEAIRRLQNKAAPKPHHDLYLIREVTPETHREVFQNATPWGGFKSVTLSSAAIAAALRKP